MVCYPQEPRNGNKNPYYFNKNVIFNEFKVQEIYSTVFFKRDYSRSLQEIFRNVCNGV